MEKVNGGSVEPQLENATAARSLNLSFGEITMFRRKPLTRSAAAAQLRSPETARRNQTIPPFTHLTSLFCGQVPMHSLAAP
jgi:hypothetical protein